uniref:Reverse transcriptase domain-containing protein n=1 Tax=Octopus bimaculoides TaxID=37653 RepID=A0A0L8FLS2_OCTBM
MVKAFNRVPRSLIWWSMRKLGIDEWLVRAVQAMYRDAVSKKAVRCNLRKIWSGHIDTYSLFQLGKYLIIKKDNDSYEFLSRTEQSLEGHQ